MKNIFEGIEDVHIFLYDILIASQDAVSHKQNMKIVYNRIRALDMSINYDKYTFCTISVKYLGRIVENGTIRADLDQLDTSCLEHEPNTKTQLRSLIGYIEWFQAYIKDLSSRLKPLPDKLPR